MEYCGMTMCVVRYKTWQHQYGGYSNTAVVQVRCYKGPASNIEAATDVDAVSVVETRML